MRTALLMLSLLSSLSVLGQEEDTSAAAKEYIAKMVTSAEAWVFARDWQTTVSCPDLNGLVEGVLNMQLRKAMAGAPITPPPVHVQHFVLTRRGRALGLQVKLTGLPDNMLGPAENEANKWLATAPQAAMLKSILLQPLGFPTLGQGAVLKDAKLSVRQESDAAIDIMVTPSPTANTMIMGRRVESLALRIDKTNNVLLILQGNLSGGGMLQARFSYDPAKATDGTSFAVPTTVAFKQKGVESLAPGMNIPASTTMTYGNYVIGGGAAQ